MLQKQIKLQTDENNRVLSDKEASRTLLHSALET